MAEQAESLTAAINHLHAEIQHHIAQSPEPTVALEKCLLEVDRLGQQLRATFYHKQGRTIPVEAGKEGWPRLRVGSPRLANPAQVGDFALEVTEEPRDAGL